MKNPVYFLFLLILVSAMHAQTNQTSEKQIMKPVLIVIDTQNEFMQYIDPADLRIGLDMINWAIATFRSMDFPIIRVYHTNPHTGPVKDSEGFQFHEKLSVRDTDPMVVKNFPNSFKKTELDKLLKDMGANTLFLCGLSAVGCVISTYHGAKELDYDCVLLRDALLSHDAGHTHDIERIFDSVSLDVTQMMLKYAGK